MQHVIYSMKGKVITVWTDIEYTVQSKNNNNNNIINTNYIDDDDDEDKFLKKPEIYLDVKWSPGVITSRLFKDYRICNKAF